MSGNKQSPQRTLSAFDGACIIVGIIIGAGIYQTTPMVAENAGSVQWILGFWVLGGCLALVGALCYVELAMTLPTTVVSMHIWSKPTEKKREVFSLGSSSG